MDLFTHSSADGDLRCSCFLALTNNATMNICVQLLVRTSVFISLGKHLGVELLGHMVTPSLTL